jgi:hypothetical protein
VAAIPGIAALVEGASINATSRMTRVEKHTILKLLQGLDVPQRPTMTPTSVV